MPTNFSGWVVTLVLLGCLLFVFRAIDSMSHSVSDTLLKFSPWFIAILLLYDILCFRLGEYPSWWRRENVERKT